MRFKRQNPPAIPHRISAYEQALGKLLPDDYRRFLEASNGGWAPSPSVFHYNMWDAQNVASVVINFWGLGENLDQPVLRQGLREGYIEIGMDPVGNPLLLSLRESDFGHVYFWETDWDFQLPGEEHPSVAHLANSFTEFLELLTEE
jgi:hypothetical protein